MRHEKRKCPKCDNDAFETDIFQATGGTFTKLFNIQNKKFTTVSCTRCQYTEIYKAETSALSNFFDFFVGG
jgi:predicted nucleic-acid-binding Zn-ribbon protein